MASSASQSLVRQKDEVEQIDKDACQNPLKASLQPSLALDDEGSAEAEDELDQSGTKMRRSVTRVQ